MPGEFPKVSEVIITNPKHDIAGSDLFFRGCVGFQCPRCTLFTFTGGRARLREHWAKLLHIRLPCRLHEDSAFICHVVYLVAINE